MIHPISSSKVGEILAVAKYLILGVLLTLATISVLFLKAHWVGFSKFISDPVFFDQIEISRSFEVKK